MTDSHRSEDVSVYNERSLQRLAWAIEASVGQFQLIFAHCNYASVRSQLLERLQDLCSVDIHILTLKESDRTLFATIQAALGEAQPAALMVLGLESVRHLDQMLTAADQVREEFRKHFQFPLVLWVNDAVGQKLMELAPNLESWGTRREFAIALDELATWLRQTAEQCFVTQFNAVPNECLQAAELEAARQDLLRVETALDPELEANLESLLGFATESDRQFDAALEHYQRAALLWQQLNQLERQVYTLVCIAFCYHLKALQHQETDNPDAQLTREYLQQCQQIFEQTKRPDLIANSIATLGKILRDLQDWESLQTLAQIALQVHETENNPLELAQDYGFLAEVALAQKRWSDANQFAQKALDVLSSISTDAVRLSHSSRYRFSLALAQYQLNRIQEAIFNLKAAKSTCNPLDDLRLYLDILSQLQRFYFEQKNYLEAYEIKQKQRSVEQQFGLRAFIGAGQLESQHQENLVQTQADEGGTIAPEIIASGRQRDVEQLVERVVKNETKIIVIHGPSGVGKSSLVNAGLIPALQGKQIGIQTVVAVPIRVYTNWVEELGRLLAEKCQDNGIDDTSTASPANPISAAAIWEQLHQNDQLNRRTVLIFDQFEEFFFACPLVERRKFFEFLGECLQILSVKVVLSLREDYLHYLLECNRLLSRGITSHSILSEDVLYSLNNFSPKEARSLIQQLTERANFHLESGLIDRLVDDLASEIECVRPIELQVVGAQLQAEHITTLAGYQAYGSKEELVQRYLAEVVADCGEAVKTFRQAKTWNPQLNFDPEAKAKPLAEAASQVKHGEELTKKGNIAGAVAALQNALKLDPDFEFELRTRAFSVLIENGQSLINDGKGKEAITAYAQAQKLAPKFEISADSWNTLCRQGGLRGYAKEVMFACEKAVALTLNNGSYRDSRGLARALTGNTKGAIEDFQAYIKRADEAESKAQRQRWIDALKAGKKPFTPEEIKRLRDE